jgi:PIN domain nuclease of toxin-antitoxin system
MHDLLSSSSRTISVAEAVAIVTLHSLPSLKRKCIAKRSTRQSRALTQHKNPFDRLLIAQALAEILTIITQNSPFRRYDVELFR